MVGTEKMLGAKRWGFGGLWAVWAVAMLGLADNLSGVVFLGTDDPEHNTSAPEGDLVGSGWQFLGRWGIFVGTVIGPHHFITARHVGGRIGRAFQYRGEAYTARAIYEFGPNDLRIWEVCEAMPGPYASLYLDQDELHKPLVVFGRGRLRGAEVWLDTPEGRELRGWRVGPSDNRLRWGQNEVSEIVDYADLYDSAEPGELEFLWAEFNREGSFNEAHLSVGDSGGAVFLERDGVWALAGVVMGAFGRFNEVPENPGYLATLFDGGGFYLRSLAGDPVRRPRVTNLGCDNLMPRAGDQYEWIFLDDSDEAVGNGFLATRISNYADWIGDVMAGRVAPCFQGPWAVSASSAEGAFDFELSQKHDPASRTFRIPIKEGARFFRVAGCQPFDLAGWSVEGDSLVLRYQAAP